MADDKPSKAAMETARKGAEVLGWPTSFFVEEFEFEKIALIIDAEMHTEKARDTLLFVKRSLNRSLELGYTVHDMLHAVGWTAGKQDTVMGTIDATLRELDAQ
jgi:hypothetical protein